MPFEVYLSLQFLGERMKTTLCVLLAALSLAAIAQEKIDVSNAKPEILLKAAKQTFISLTPLMTHRNYFIQDKSAKSYNAENFSFDRRYCKISKDLDSLQLKKLEQTPLKRLEIKRASKNYISVFLDGERLMNCRHALPTIESLTSILPTVTISRAYVNGIDKLVLIDGITDDANSEAIIRVEGKQELTDSNNIMLENAKNGEIESELYASSESLRSIVKVLAVGPSLAKVQVKNQTKVVSVKDLKGVKPSLSFSPNEAVDSAKIISRKTN